MCKLNIGFWNVHGLNTSKVNDNDFLSYVHSYNVIGFVETLSSESPGNLPEFSTPFVVKPSKTKKKGRASGGISVYCKPHIKKRLKKFIDQTYQYG